MSASKIAQQEHGGGARALDLSLSRAGNAMSATTPQKKVRDSGIELLRLVCIFLIIAHHYYRWGGYPAFTWESICFKEYSLQCLALFGSIACSVFILISGYFTVQKKAPNIVEYYRRAVPLAVEMTFYILLALVLALTFDWIKLGRALTIQSLFPIIWGNWFIVYYLLLFAVTPFINEYLLSLSRNRFLKIIIGLMILWSVIPTFTIFMYRVGWVKFGGWDYSNVDYFAIMYMIGAFIKLHGHTYKPYANGWNLLVAVFASIFILASCALFDYASVVTHNNLYIDKARYFHKPYTIPAVILAVSVFLFFKNLHFKSSFINWMATSVVAVYIIHDNEIMRPVIWEYVWPNIDYFNAGYFKLYMHVVLKIIAVFVCCLAIDKIRIATIHRIFNGLVMKAYDKIGYGLLKAFNSWCRLRVVEPAPALESGLSDMEEAHMAAEASAPDGRGAATR